MRGDPMRLPSCKICRHPMNFAIQKAIDEGMKYADIVKKFSTLEHPFEDYHVAQHVSKGHRNALITFGVADWEARRRGIELGKILADYIKEWVKTRKGTIRDADALKALDLLAKIEGVPQRHEIEVAPKRTPSEVLRDYLRNGE